MVENKISQRRVIIIHVFIRLSENDSKWLIIFFAASVNKQLFANRFTKTNLPALKVITCQWGGESLFLLPQVFRKKKKRKCEVAKVLAQHLVYLQQFLTLRFSWLLNWCFYWHLRLYWRNTDLFLHVMHSGNSTIKRAIVPTGLLYNWLTVLFHDVFGY